MITIKTITVLGAIVLEALGGPASRLQTFHKVIDSPSFRVPEGPRTASMGKRDSSFDCDFTLGIAYLNSTKNGNIPHLNDVHTTNCTVAPNSCTRVAYQDLSGIFFCNRNQYSITTKCGNLVAPATRLMNSCQYASYYTFGVWHDTVHDETQNKDVDYELRIAAGGWE